MLERIVINNGLKIQYEIHPGSKKTPLIFLHGGGGSLSAWEIILPYFMTKNFSLLTVDLRGHGLSDRPKDLHDYALEKHAEDILCVLKQEKIEKAVLVGHCLGSMAAATFTSIYPAKVKKLILINTNYELPWLMSSIVLRPIWMAFLHFLKYIFPYKPKLSKGVNYFRFIGSFDIDLRRFYQDMKVMGIYSAIRQMIALFSWPGKGYFEKISVPTLVIAGKHDLFFPKGTGEDIIKLVGNSKLEYIDSNHISIVNSAKEVFQKIEDYLKLDI